MKQHDPAVDRLATVFLVRGFTLLAFAAIAIRRPEQTLNDAVRYAAGVAVFLGIVELGMGLAGDALLSTRAFRAGHALMSIGFGAVAGSAASLPPGRALAAAMIWLGAYAAYLLLLAARLWYFRRTRDALLLWSAVNVAAAVACLNMASASRASVLVAGALYTVTLGAVTIAAARWIRRGWMRVERVEFAGG